MSFDVFLHPRVEKYLNSLTDNDKRLCKESLFCLKINPFKKRSGCDIKKMEGHRKNQYRLRIGIHRFEYIVLDNEVIVQEGFPRERGYR